MHLKKILIILAIIFTPTASLAKTETFYAPSAKEIQWESSDSVFWIGKAHVNNETWMTLIATNQGKAPELLFLDEPPEIKLLIEESDPARNLHQIRFHFETLPDHAKGGMSLHLPVAKFDSCIANKNRKSVTCYKDEEL